MSECRLAASRINKNSAHRLGSSGKKVTFVLPANLVGRPNESKVGLVDKCRGLQGVIAIFSHHPHGGKLSQLSVHKRQQLGGGNPIARLGRVHQIGDVGHLCDTP